jgi:hypothetical protein
MRRQKSLTALSVDPLTVPEFDSTAFRHAAASGWTPEATGRSNLGLMAHMGDSLSLE